MKRCTEGGARILDHKINEPGTKAEVGKEASRVSFRSAVDTKIYIQPRMREHFIRMQLAAALRNNTAHRKNEH